MIRATGADIVVECGDIAERATADRLVAAATITGLPLRGVLHAAAVVEDATLANITDGLIDRDWRPKAYGAWNLHEATLDEPLDWFCSFSSAAALIGSPGQGAYAAANSWLDAFTHWRKSQGLPATSIAWGAWGEVGRATALAEDTDTAIAPDEGAYAFESMLRHDRAYAGYAPLIGTPWLTTFAQRSKFAEMFKSADAGAKGSSKLRAELNELPVEEWPGRTAEVAVRADRTAAAALRRSGPSAVRVRTGLPRHARIAHPGRIRDRHPHQRTEHHRPQHRAGVVAVPRR